MSDDIMEGCEPFSHHSGPLGVLVLHGFTGNPAALRPFAERLAKEGYSVELPRLPGHGTTVEDMMTTDWNDWSSAALSAYDELSERCDRVAIVGLSMGGGLTAYVAEQRSSVVGCVFVNPLVKAPPIEMIEMLNVLVETGTKTIESIGSDVKKEGALEASYNETPLVPAQSLFVGVASVFENLASINAPSLLFSSREDHVVTSDNGDALVEYVTGPIERIWLEDSYHVAVIDNDQELFETKTVEFLARVLS